MYIIIIRNLSNDRSKSLPKQFLHIVRSRASSFNWQYPLLSSRSSSSFLRLLPRLLVTSICPFILPSIICCRRQFLRKMWPIQLAFRFRITVSLYNKHPCMSSKLASRALSLSCLVYSIRLVYQPSGFVFPHFSFTGFVIFCATCCTGGPGSSVGIAT